MITLVKAAAFALAVLTAAQRLAAGPALAVLPFENFSGANAAAQAIQQRIAAAAAAKGWQIVAPATLDPLLEKDRVRYLDSLDATTRAHIVRETGAQAIVSGSLYEWSAGRNPIVALSARMVRADGSVAWGDVHGLAASETEGMLGFGKKNTTEEVAAEVVAKLMKSFPAAGEERALLRGPRKPLFGGGPISFRAADLDPSTPHRVCVLPFDNTSALPESARVIADLLALRLAAANGFEVLEPAVLREAALRSGIASFRRISSDDLLRLSKIVGTPLFLRGTIYDYGDASSPNPVDPPKVQIELSLVDVESHRVLWAAQHGHRGSDYTGWLMLGSVSNAVTLTDRVLAEMIDLAAKPATKHAAGDAAAGAAQKRLPEKHSRLRGAQEGERQ